MKELRILTLADILFSPVIANLKFCCYCYGLLRGTSQPQPETQSAFVAVSEASHWATLGR